MRPIPNSVNGDAYSLLYEGVDTMVCTLDLEGRFTDVNRAGELLTGYSRDELVGRNALELIAPDVRERAVDQFLGRLSKAGDRPPDQSVLIARDGRRVPIEVTSTTFGQHGPRRREPQPFADRGRAARPRRRSRRHRTQARRGGAATKRAAVPQLVRVGGDRDGARRDRRCLPGRQLRTLRDPRLFARRAG